MGVPAVEAAGQVKFGYEGNELIRVSSSSGQGRAH